jgi:N6-adenosine-specific RNA methylase IME4
MSTPKSNFILADPPWTFKTYSKKGKGRSAEQHYDCMTLDDIRHLPVEKILLPDAYLALWVTTPMLFNAQRVAESWGFNHYSGSLFAWVKLNKGNGKPFMGMGYSTRKNLELCLLFKRGKGVSRVDAGVPEIIMSVRGKHSEKPIEAHERIERLFSENLTNPTELFARKKRDGWMLWGNEIISDFILEV